MIRRPFPKDFFMSEADRLKQVNETEEALKKYISESRFEKPFVEENFISILSRVSQTVDSKKVLESTAF